MRNGTICVYAVAEGVSREKAASANSSRRMDCAFVKKQEQTEKEKA